MIGLALSGLPAARLALLTFQQSSTISASDKALVEEALRAQATIASNGLLGYYEGSE